LREKQVDALDFSRRGPESTERFQVAEDSTKSKKSLDSLGQ
jgi:hypothetical protein